MKVVQQQVSVSQPIDEKPVVAVVTNGVKPLSPEQEELINRLVYFQEEFDQPSDEDLRKISVLGSGVFAQRRGRVPNVFICMFCSRLAFTNRTVRQTSSTSLK